MALLRGADGEAAGVVTPQEIDYSCSQVRDGKKTELQLVSVTTSALPLP